MGCLLCGKPVGLVRKLKDTEFCSNEHRHEWFEARGRVFVDRLVEARASMERARDRYLVRKAAPILPPEPAAASFLVQTPVELSGSAVPAAYGPEFRPATGVRRPALGLSPARPRKLAGFQPDLPWPAWNAGLRFFGYLGLEWLACSPNLDYVRAAARVFGSWTPDLPGADLPVGALAATRRPDPAGRDPVPYLPAVGYTVPQVWPGSTEQVLAAA